MNQESLSSNNSANLEGRIKSIEERNQRVEADKAWETSKIRILVITGLTYIFMVLTMSFSELDRPFVGALIPTLGYFLSTLSLQAIRKRFSTKPVNYS